MTLDVEGAEGGGLDHQRLIRCSACGAGMPIAVNPTPASASSPDIHAKGDHDASTIAIGSAADASSK